jgi:deoxycytidylate deaminase
MDYCDKEGDPMNCSDSDIGTLFKVAYDSNQHSSGGSYNMMARWMKGSFVITGANRLHKPAHLVDSSYPDISGIHAELDSWKQHKKMKGGTIYVAGTVEASGNLMQNTLPCVYCASLLFSSGVRFVVGFEDGIPVKYRVKDLV